MHAQHGNSSEMAKTGHNKIANNGACSSRMPQSFDIECSLFASLIKLILVSCAAAKNAEALMLLFVLAEWQSGQLRELQTSYELYVYDTDCHCAESTFCLSHMAEYVACRRGSRAMAFVSISGTALCSTMSVLNGMASEFVSGVEHFADGKPAGARYSCESLVIRRMQGKSCVCVCVVCAQPTTCCFSAIVTVYRTPIKL